MKILLILLEYILLPLLAILGSLLLKRDAGIKSHSSETFLDDLTIDVKVISSLGLVLFAISCILHNEHQSSIMTTFSFIGTILTLLIYIGIQHTLKINYFKFDINSRITLFGVKNALHKAVSWLIIVLVCYVFVGVIFLEMEKIGWSSQELLAEKYYYILFVLFLIFLGCLFSHFFFWLLNRVCTSFLSGTLGYSNTYSDAYVNEEISSPEALDSAIRQYGITLATLKANDPLAIGVTLRLHETFEKKYKASGDMDFFHTAEACIDKAISLLSDKAINQNKEYLIDAYMEKIDFLKRNNKNDDADKLRTDVEILTRK